MTMTTMTIESSSDFIVEIITHEFFLAMYGVLVWYSGVYALDKKHRKNLTFKKWRTENNANIFLTVLLAPLVIIFDDEAIFALNHLTGGSYEMNEFIYVCAGPVTSGFYKLITRIKGNPQAPA